MFTKHDAKRIMDVLEGVGHWSHENFGHQESKIPDTATLWIVTGSKHPATLTYLAPLMGITEELGEYVGATTDEERKDALADIGIYLCDFYYRTGLNKRGPDNIWSLEWCLRHIQADFPRRSATTIITERVGWLNHVILKTHQGIRGYDDIPKSRAELKETVVQLFLILDEELRHAHDSSIMDALEEVFNKIVSKRNWKANKVEG